MAFEYVHCLSTPEIGPRPDAIRKASITVEAGSALVFGMLDADTVVRAETVVYDPQSPAAPKRFRERGSSATRLALVMNETEAHKLSGEAEIDAAARSILASEGAEVVVVKRGLRGALVVTARTEDAIPAYRSDASWLIGSGDIFSAAFAYCWSELGQPPAEAADMASKAVCIYCETKAALIDLDLLRARRFEEATVLEGTVYLAGPFFSLAEVWLVEEARRALQRAGLHVLSPLHDVGRSTDIDVAAMDIELLTRSDRVFALLDHTDAGTVFEIGYAVANEIPVVGFRSMPRVSEDGADCLKMIVGSGSLIYGDLPTAIAKVMQISKK